MQPLRSALAPVALDELTVATSTHVRLESRGHDAVDVRESSVPTAATVCGDVEGIEVVDSQTMKPLHVWRDIQ
jgi:hypothetical protein